MLRHLAIAMSAPLASVAILFAIAGCNSHGSALNPPMVTIPARLYVANFSNNNDNFPGSLLAFALPFSSNVAPLVTVAPPLANDGPFGLVLDGSNHLFVGYSASVEVYKLPLTSSPTAAFQITTAAGESQGLALDGSGDLIAGITDTLYVFPAPLSSASTASVTLLLPSGNHCCLQQIAVHGSTLAIATDTGFTDHIYVYSLPITGASTPTASITTGAGQYYGGVAFDSSGNLYASGSSPKQIEIYAPPFSNASTPTTKISTTTLAFPGSLGFDTAGNLYYAVSEPGTLYEYTPPFTSGSTPAASTSISFGQLVGNVVAGN